MYTPAETYSFRSSPAFGRALRRLRDELVMLAKALMQPAKLIAEVEQMHALRVEADRVEASHPVKAGALRRQAARLGLR